MEDYHRKWLTSNARFQDSWERMAYANLPHYTDVDPSICSSLLEIYWAWQAPLHNCVYRRCFFRDMALGGPYFSLFLLNVIFAHACRHMPDDDPRFAPFDRGDLFLKKALLLLIDEMEEPKPRIPTIQGLLILGGRQCAVGKSSQGWLYTGMAIRMVIDLGLHLKRPATVLMKDYEPDDLEVRKRLYLSVYAWDKSISLCLGRPPSLPTLPHPASTLFDLSDDRDIWQPPRVLHTDKTYPETRCYSTLTLKHFCELAEVINESYSTVYSGTARNITPASIFGLERKLHAFHRRLPDALRIEDPSNLQSCVPPHILLCLNILYHTTLILIFRPFFIWRWHANLRQRPLALRAETVCTEQAADVNELFRAYGRLFNFQYQSYLVSYCVYTAATIDVRLMRHEDRTIADTAADRLTVTLRMLETEVKQTPGIRRSTEIIRSHLDNPANDMGPQPEGRGDPCHSPSAVQDQSVDTVTDPSDLSVMDGLPFIMDAPMEMTPAMMDWGVDDSGGGFVPNMAYWTPFSQPF
ncbi:hypothetical protein P170DRAFT_400774 [Aspergillus steynii IBT 23096]|uniref:Xylanolytic transcriptional activator regulatory domain-containing protein n=1 Tax=Aspergillus steynii IBT 23096 TaxID=1392250 RepID=A0A2I2GKV7_9EURO|nr:uncharacterized protein P170DRAFT_400774 [Aspergillus steynii IBT 23096]PLB53497.1 hypothetical protein P170DRAFT_400774 [Aspergillus steynii IBT 23096]